MPCGDQACKGPLNYLEVLVAGMQSLPVRRYRGLRVILARDLIAGSQRSRTRSNFYGAMGDDLAPSGLCNHREIGDEMCV